MRPPPSSRSCRTEHAMAANGSSNGNGFSQRYSTIIQTVTVMALGVAGFWGSVISPMQNEIKDKLSKEEHAEFKLRIDKDILRIEYALAELNRKIVPRDEHGERWRA